MQKLDRGSEQIRETLEFENEWIFPRGEYGRNVPVGCGRGRSR